MNVCYLHSRPIHSELAIKTLPANKILSIQTIKGTCESSHVPF